ncbi:MAG: hypothetical protein Q4E16_06465 [Neisseria sp.]|nr:hypothetical protein [Neisseria sp.]
MSKVLWDFAAFDAVCPYRFALGLPSVADGMAVLDWQLNKR